MHALLQTAPGVDQVVAPDQEPPGLDFGVALMSLPAIFKTTLESIPAGVPYLFADAAAIATWRERLAAIAHPRVGIAWQGTDFYRSIPLACFAPLAAAGAHLVSLQKGAGSEQLAPLAGQLGIVDIAPELDEGGAAFVDTAAAMMNLDLVVTCDTSIAHLAGASACRCGWRCRSRTNWRWISGRDDSPWYPSMRLFRQTRFNDWPEVFERISAQFTASTII